MEESERYLDFWAVTSFFNPAGYRIHREKYRTFRDHIGAPLLTVELSYGTEFELGPGDADLLLQLRTDQVLWQKERLLNLAVEALPEECRFVAWVDADIVFDRLNWIAASREALKTRRLVQPYRRVYDLPLGANPGPLAAEQALLTRPSLGWIKQGKGFHLSDTRMNMLGVCSPGHAWAMRRTTLQEAGLYDAMIVGGGDLIVALAALGHLETPAERYAMNDAQAQHYRRWADSFHAATRGSVGVVEGDLYHLWHGDLSDRRYGLRYPGIEPFCFDPERDIALDENGVWRWATHKPELHAYVASYFRSRKEDG